MTMRYCENSDCRGDCETCNRAPIENQPLPATQPCRDERALESLLMRVRNGTSSEEDSQRLLGAYLHASHELTCSCEELVAARC